MKISGKLPEICDENLWKFRVNFENKFLGRFYENCTQIFEKC